MQVRTLDDAATIALFLGALVVAGGWTALGEKRDVSEAEARTLARLPEWSWDGASIEAYPRAFEQWYDDHFGPRESLLPAYQRLRFHALDISPTDEVIVGRDGYLFLAEGTREFAPLDEDELAAWEAELAQRQAFLDERGIDYLVVVVPDKTDVYPEKLPAALAREKARASRIDAFCEAMSARSSTRILNLAPIVRAEKERDELYFRNDPHWNALGAWIGYAAIVDELREHHPELRVVPWEALGIEKRRVGGGGLARMMGLVGSVSEQSYKQRKDELESGERFEIETGSEPSFGTDRPGLPLRLLMYRDSYTTQMQPYLSATFGRAVYLWRRPTFRDFKTWVSREKPDIVIEERVSRFLDAEHDE